MKLQRAGWMELAVDFERRGLTPMEAAVAAFIALNAGQLTYVDLVALLWPNPNYEPDFPENLVNSYCSKIRAKADRTGIYIPTRIGRGRNDRVLTVVLRSRSWLSTRLAA
jgi:hypothetical protein